MSSKIAIDTSKTFTEIVAIDDKSGRQHMLKTSSTRSDRSIGLLNGVHKVLEGWDPVAPMVPVRSYGKRPRPAKGHAAILDNLHAASAASGMKLIEATIKGLVELVTNFQNCCEERKH